MGGWEVSWGGGCVMTGGSGSSVVGVVCAMLAVKEGGAGGAAVEVKRQARVAAQACLSCSVS
jgi:hypothetical protein